MKTRWIVAGVVIGVILLASGAMVILRGSAVAVTVTRTKSNMGFDKLRVESSGQENFKYRVLRRDSDGNDQIVSGGQHQSKSRLGVLRVIFSLGKRRVPPMTMSLTLPAEDFTWTAGDTGPKTSFVYPHQEYEFAEVKGEKYIYVLDP